MHSNVRAGRPGFACFAIMAPPDGSAQARICSTGKGITHSFSLKVKQFMQKLFVILLLANFAAFPAAAEDIGSVNTEWKLTGSHKLVVEAIDDPKVAGVACYVAKPERGGVAGAFGVAEEVSDVSIACRQVGPIRFKEPVPLQEDAFNERRSLIFKTLHVVRMVDVSRNTLVYLTYSDRIISGSAKNSVTAVTVDRSMPIPVKR